MNCPICNVALRPRQYEGEVEVDECPQCRGIWLDEDELERIEAHAAADQSARPAPENTVAESFNMARDMSRPPLKCPKCGEEMDREEAHPGAMVMIDECPSCHGRWLDFGEAQSLEQFVERMREQDKHPHKIRALLKRLFE